MKVSRRGFLKYAVAGVVVVAAVGGGAYYYLSSKSSSKPDTVTIAWPYQITDLHPYRLNNNGIQESPLDAIYERYELQDRNLNFQPGVVSDLVVGSQSVLQSGPQPDCEERSDLSRWD